MYLSKTNYCKGIQCKKMLWLDKYFPEEKEEIDSSQVFETGKEVGELAKNLFGFHFDIPYNENLEVMIQDTKALLYNQNVVLTEASFCYDTNFCSVDILKKEGEEIEIYEVKSSTDIKDIYIEDLSYQVYILTQLGYKVKKASLVYLNSNYVREKELELEKLFFVQDVTEIVFSKLEQVASCIKEIKGYVENRNERAEDIDKKCFKPYPCPYFSYCSGHLNNSVFDLKQVTMNKKIDLYKKGYIVYQDLLKSDLQDKYKMQIEYSLYEKEDYINKEKIKEFCSTLSYPLYFLDFESYQEAIPMHEGTHPFEQIPFQYSLHYYEAKGSKLKHKEFLSSIDCDPRRSLAEQLVRDIPPTVCVLAYNMSFEKMIIKKLAFLYPDLRDHLMYIHENIKDLMVPFYRQYYYTKDMQGSYSIKYVLPALFPNDSSLDYHHLELVHNGKEASSSYQQLKYRSREEQIKVRESLLKYCGLDTYAMVCIYNKLLEVIK